MSSPDPDRLACANHLLSSVSQQASTLLTPLLEPVTLNSEQILQECGQPFSHLYFPLTATVSAIQPLQSGPAVEVGTVGNEGFSGVELLANAELAINTYIVQVPGDALRMTVADFASAMDTMPELRRVAFAYLQGFLSQANQSAACNRRHAVEGRFARWMLITHDRVAHDEFVLTPKAIAAMLGTEHTNVPLISGQFQKAGLVRYGDNRLKIVNRKGLEEVSCECYRKVRDQFYRLLRVQYG